MKLFKDLVLDQLVKAAIQRLFLAIPFLGWGPLGWMVTFIINKFVDFLYDELEIYIEIKKIIFKNNKLKKAFNQESIKLKVFAENFGKDSEEFKNAKENSKKVFSDFIHFKSYS